MRVLLRSYSYVLICRMHSSSSESYNSERIKNVRHLYVTNDQVSSSSIRSYSYKRKLGDLVFNANYESGNLGSVKQIDEYEFDLTIRPDVANPRHRLWFNFTVSNQSPGQVSISIFICSTHSSYAVHVTN